MASKIIWFLDPSSQLGKSLQKGWSRITCRKNVAKHYWIAWNWSIAAATMPSKFGEPNRELVFLPCLSAKLPGIVIIFLIYGRNFVQSKGQNELEGHQGKTRTPRPWQRNRWFNAGGIKAMGGTKRTFSPDQSWAKASTASEPGFQNLEKNLGNLASKTINC